jgi:hypothetical protein
MYFCLLFAAPDVVMSICYEILKVVLYDDILSQSAKMSTKHITFNFKVMSHSIAKQAHAVSLLNCDQETPISNGACDRGCTV